MPPCQYAKWCIPFALGVWHAPCRQGAAGGSGCKSSGGTMTRTIGFTTLTVSAFPLGASAYADPIVTTAMRQTSLDVGPAGNTAFSADTSGPFGASLSSAIGTTSG